MDIPNGWALCDGNNGTPDLQNRFIVGAGDTYNPNTTGGTLQHQHNVGISVSYVVIQGYTGEEMACLEEGEDVEAGDQYPYYSYCIEYHSHEVDLYGTGHDHSAEVSAATHLPPYYALAYIMKL